MDWLNYHHLMYFWVVAREGGVTRAAQVLQVSQSAVSDQIKKLEKFIGSPLLRKSGRGVALTDTGEVVYRYATEIFSTGEELVATLRGRDAGPKSILRIGVVDVLPKLIAHALIQPALELEDCPRIVCQEGTMERLLSELAIHQIDVVLTEAPLPPKLHIRAYTHLLGECGVSIVATPELAKAHSKGFPSSLDGAPFLLPTPTTVLRRSLDQWFRNQGIFPHVRAEFDDSSLLKTFGQVGEGLFAVPSAIESQVCQQYAVRPVCRVPDVRMRFYAISAERRLAHPAVVAISEAAISRISD